MVWAPASLKTPLQVQGRLVNMSYLALHIITNNITFILARTGEDKNMKDLVVG